ncbi:MAG TPA: ThuA domain-containing protein [Thermoguttaceae bacterium]
MKRREMLLTAGAALVGLSTFPLRWVSAADKKKQKILYFTKSAGWVHSVVKREDDQLSYSEKILSDLGAEHGFDVVCSQDAEVFNGDLGEFDLIAFYTTGDPITPEQKQKLLDAISSGKPFVGIHSATDTFIKENSPEVDPFIAMLGAEFLKHDDQQKAKNKIVSLHFPGMHGLGDEIELFEEWYAFNKFAKDLHVILVQETAGMKGAHYQRPPFPATWARMHGKGRVFYTSLGHREDVWTNKIFQQILLGGMAWALGNIEADIPANINQVTPKANV